MKEAYDPRDVPGADVLSRVSSGAALVRMALSIEECTSRCDVAQRVTKAEQVAARVQETGSSLGGKIASWPRCGRELKLSLRSARR